MEQNPTRTTASDSPLHDCLSPPVAVQSPELAPVFPDSLGHAVGEVLPAVRDHVPGDAVLCGKGAGAGAEPGEGGQVGAEPQVQRYAGAVYTKL